MNAFCRLRPFLRVFGAAALLYALAACSNSPGPLAPLAKGAMAKLVITRHPSPEPTIPFADASGRMHTLAEFKGKVTLVNLWANWCAPCKLEVPSLAKLQAAYAGKPVAVVPVSVGTGQDEKYGAQFIARNPPLRFYSEPTYRLAFAFHPAIEGIPTTIIYDEQGRERARLAGGADWSGQDARAVIDVLLKEGRKGG